MSNPSSPSPPAPSATQLEELEKQLLALEQRVTALQEARDRQVTTLRGLEQRIRDTSTYAMRLVVDGEAPEQTLAVMRQGIQEAEGDLKEAKADRDSLEGRIERIRNRQDAQRAHRTSFIVSVLGLVVATVGVLAGVCAQSSQEVRGTCPPAAAAPGQ